MNDKKLIVFDWNGTLLSDTRASWLAGNVCLKFYGSKPITLQQYRETFTFPILHFYKLNGLNVDTVLAKKTEANEVFQADYERRAANARTRQGTRALLTWLKQNNHHAIILSNYVTRKIKEHTLRLKIDHYFNEILAHGCEGTTVIEHKHKLDRLKAYMNEHGYQPENITIIGDSTEEPEIAHILGITCIGITDGYITPLRLKKANPDHIVHNLQDVIDILKETS